ncbi:MAG: hypothetical protein MJH09_01350 [Cetobacterium sp.]|nr:hypothetical protein [Cetobacterium sp.]
MIKKKVSLIKTSQCTMGIYIPKVMCEILNLKKGEKMEIELKNLESNELILRKIKKEEE